MNQHRSFPLTLPVLAPLLVPLVLWGMVWIGVQPGEIRLLTRYESPELLLNRLRSIVPLVAAYLALVIMAVQWYRRQPRGFSLLSPLGLTLAYGLVGVISSAYSPDTLLSLFWVGVYLSVPVVLWAAVWGPESASRVRHIITFNAFGVIVLVAIFFVIALQQLDLGDQLLRLSTWSNCRITTPWFRQTWKPLEFLPLGDGLLRPTSVGRFAALAGIISLGGVLGGTWRLPWATRKIPWLAVFIVSFLLLWTSGARTAIIGFLVAGIVVALLYSGRRAIIAGGAAALILVPLLLLTGVPQDVAKGCLIYTAYTPGTSLLRLRVPPTIAADTTGVSEPAQSLAPTPVPMSALAPTKASEGGQGTSGSPASAATGAQTPAGGQETSGSPASAATGAQTPAGGQGTSGSPASAPAPTPASLQASIEPSERVSAPAKEPALPPPAAIKSAAPSVLEEGGITKGFFAFSGRTVVWDAAWKYLKGSPFLGYGFHADRLILGTHMHNSYLHALFQTGFIGLLPFLGALGLAWILLLRALRNLRSLSAVNKHLVIQSAGILVFFTTRTISESTAAFFGIDWLLLAPFLLFLQLVNSSIKPPQPQPSGGPTRQVGGAPEPVDSGEASIGNGLRRTG